MKRYSELAITFLVTLNALTTVGAKMRSERNSVRRLGVIVPHADEGGGSGA